MLTHVSRQLRSRLICSVGLDWVPLMNIVEAQKEIRSHFAGGFYGQLVSSVLWAISASLATFASPTMAIATLVLGGFLIFPLTELLARVNRAPPIGKTNELSALGMQIAFVLPTSMLLLFPVTRYSVYLFYPAMMVLVLSLIHI